MHIGNGIICPVTGIPMILAAGGAMFFAFKNAKNIFSKDKILLTVLATIFVFALQMINFSIPLTGSSGHIIGAILLCLLLGKNVGFLAVCFILTIQALFFADGSILALGCNIFNMGFLACFVTYPLFFEQLNSKNKPILGIILASIVALQLGSIAVVVESALSNSIMASSVLNFAALMQAIHLPIGIVEGLFTTIIYALSKAFDYKKIAYSFGFASIILSGFIFSYASSKPDGLEWSLLNISDFVTYNTQGFLYNLTNSIQQNLSVLPENGFGNIIGLMILAISMYVLCLVMNCKEADEK